MAHEINLFWAAHSVHHSSEEYNFSTAFRQSAFQVYTSWSFYLPLALVVPPSVFYLHKQINLLYQFWIHTKMVNRMGLLEWILNTPSHHRVHHGRNPRYLDKNYGGILIIWDRMFNTFQQEDETPYYGLVHPLQSWNLFDAQLGHFKYILDRVKQEHGFWNKWAVIWKGPGWTKGSPRLGNPSDIPEINPKQGPYDPYLPPWLTAYITIHFFVLIFFFSLLSSPTLQSVYPLHLLVTLFLVYSLSTFSTIFDKKPQAFFMELTRITIFLVAELICWIIYKDEFVVLWYRDPTSQGIPYINRPLKILRVFFLFSAMWIIARSSILPSFYGEKISKQIETERTNTIEPSEKTHSIEAKMINNGQNSKTRPPRTESGAIQVGVLL